MLLGHAGPLDGLSMVLWILRITGWTRLPGREKMLESTCWDWTGRIRRTASGRAFPIGRTDSIGQIYLLRPVLQGHGETSANVHTSYTILATSAVARCVRSGHGNQLMAASPAESRNTAPHHSRTSLSPPEKEPCLYCPFCQGSLRPKASRMQISTSISRLPRKNPVDERHLQGTRRGRLPPKSPCAWTEPIYDRD